MLVNSLTAARKPSNLIPMSTRRFPVGFMASRYFGTTTLWSARFMLHERLSSALCDGPPRAGAVPRVKSWRHLRAGELAQLVGCKRYFPAASGALPNQSDRSYEVVIAAKKTVPRACLLQ